MTTYVHENKTLMITVYVHKDDNRYRFHGGGIHVVLLVKEGCFIFSFISQIRDRSLASNMVCLACLDKVHGIP